MQLKAVDLHNDRPFLGTKNNETGNWDWTSFTQFGELVDNMRGALEHIGVNENDKVGVISNNRFFYSSSLIHHISFIFNIIYLSF